MQQKSEFEMNDFIKAFGKCITAQDFWKVYDRLKNQGIELTYEMYDILFDLTSTYYDALKLIRCIEKSKISVNRKFYTRQFWKLIYDVQLDRANSHFEKIFKRPASKDDLDSKKNWEYEVDIWIETQGKLEFNYDLLFGDDKLNEEDFQNQIQDKNIFIDKIVDKPKIVERNVKSLNRNPRVSFNAINRANFQCEIDIEHETFLNNNSKKQYIEAHHLIPLKYQSQFEKSLDVQANIVALCPNCHRKLHHGVKKDVYNDIEKLFNSRNEKLLLCGLDIKLDQLQKMY